MGHVSSPLDFPPHHLVTNNRYDSLTRAFRTLYCSESPHTCLSEVLAEFRPSVADRDEFKRSGRKNWKDVTMAWRRKHVLVPAQLMILSGEILSLEDQSLLISLEDELADQLKYAKVQHLTLAVTQREDRPLTRAIADALFRRGAAGIRYPSKFDGAWCYALFEGKSELIQRGSPTSLADPLPEFDELHDIYGLTLEL
ncbi:MAG: RES family NAD+ phosphorylase [Thermoanaerobaculia bacterium]